MAKQRLGPHGERRGDYASLPPSAQRTGTGGFATRVRLPPLPTSMAVPLRAADLGFLCPAGSENPRPFALMSPVVSKTAAGTSPSKAMRGKACTAGWKRIERAKD